MAMRAAELEVLVTADTSQAQSGIQAFSNQLHGLLGGRLLQNFGQAALGWVGDMVQSGAAFEQTMLRIDRLSGGTGAMVDQLSQKAFKVDQMTVFSAQQIAESMEQLAREGATPEQLLGGWTDAAINFAAVIGEDVVSSANIFGQVMRVFADQNISAAETSDILSQAILRSGKSASTFMSGLQYAGAIADEFGVPLRDIATTESYLISQGLQARTVGTGLRSMFIELAAGADEFGMSHGVQAFDPVTGEFAGIPTVIDQFHKLISTMSDAEALTFLEETFGKSASSPLLTLFRGGIEAYDEHAEKMKNLGTAASFMSALMDTTAGAIDRMQAALSNAGRAIGVVAGQMLTPFINLFGQLIGNISQAPPIVLGAVAAFVLLGGILATIAGTLMVFDALGGFALIVTGLQIMTVTALGAAAALGLVAGALYFFRDDLPAIGGHIKDAAGVLGDFLDYLSGVDQGSGTWGDKLEKLPEPLQRSAHAIGTIVEGVRDLWFFASKGDWDRFFTRLPGELQQMGTGFRALGQEIHEAFDAIDWGGVFSAVGDVVWKIGSVTLTGLVKLGEGLIGLAGGAWNWVLNKIYGGGDGGGAGTVAGGAGGAGMGVGTGMSSGEIHNLPIGTIVVDGLVKLSDYLLDIASDIIGWVIGKLGGGGETTNFGNGGAGTGAGGAGGAGMGVDASSTSERTYPIGTILVDGEIQLGPTLSAYAGRLMDWAAGKLGLGGDMEGSGQFDAMGDQIYAQAGAPYSIGTIIIDGLITLGAELLKLQANATAYVLGLMGEITAKIAISLELSWNPTEGLNADAHEAGVGIGESILPALGRGIASAFGFQTGGGGSDLNSGGTASAIGNIITLPLQIKIAIDSFLSGIVLGIGKYLVQSLTINTGNIMQGFDDQIAMPLYNWAKGLMGSIGGFISGALGKAMGWGSSGTADTGLVDAQGNTITGSSEGVFSTIFDGIAQMIHDSLLGSLVSVGSDLFSQDENPFLNLTAGIAGWVRDAFSGVGADIVNALPGWAKMLIGGNILGAFMELMGGSGGGGGIANPVTGSQATGLFDSMGEQYFGDSKYHNQGTSESTQDYYNSQVTPADTEIPILISPQKHTGFPEEDFTSSNQFGPPAGFTPNAGWQPSPNVPAGQSGGSWGGGTQETGPESGKGNSYGVTQLPNVGAGPGPGAMLADVGAKMPAATEMKFTADNSEVMKAAAANFDIARAWSANVSKGKFTADNVEVMTAAAASFDIGRAWDGQEYQATFSGDAAPAMIAAAACFDIGNAWDIQDYWATFSLDVAPAMIAAAAAFDIGNAWSGQVFTASFSIDTSGLDAAVAAAQRAAQTISDLMPHSPAKRGPLARRISFDYIGDNLIRSMSRMSQGAYAGMDRISGALDREMGPSFGTRKGSTAIANQGGTTVNQYFALTAEDLARLQQDGQAGRVSVKNVSNELKALTGMQ